VESFTLQPGERKLVPTGVAAAIPPGMCGLVLPRSGLAIKHGISCVNAPGLIDPNYRGELMVILINLGSEPWTAQSGDRIAQLLITPFAAPVLSMVTALPDTERGEAGFGSSGR
jgi:dUTP pyrophosphatase